MRITLSARGGADAELVWQRYFRPELWSQWSPQIRRVDYPERAIRAGGTGRVHGPGITVDFRITDVDPAARRWAWEVRVPVLGCAIGLEHGVQALADGTRTWLRVRGAPLLVIGYAPAAQWALSRLVRP